MRLVPLGSCGAYTPAGQNRCTADPVLDVGALEDSLAYRRYGHRYRRRSEGTGHHARPDNSLEGVGWKVEVRPVMGTGRFSGLRYGGGPYPSDVAGCGDLKSRSGPVAPLVQSRSSFDPCSNWECSKPVQTRCELWAERSLRGAAPVAQLEDAPKRSNH